MAQIDKPNLHFTATTWSGTGSQQTISLPFQADWIWVKNRNNTANHAAQDAVNGFGSRLSPDRSVTLGSEPNGIGTVSGSGFNFQGDYSGNGYNASGRTYVSWNWKANGQGSANTTGTINTTYTTANTAAGFSICKWTGTGSAGTIGHGLSAVPRMIIIKRLDSADTWWVYHASNSSANDSNDAYLALNEQNAASTSGGSGLFNSTAPTSSVFSVGTNTGVNGSGGTYVAYVFAEKKGFSRFSQYEGNSSTNGTFVYTGFKPAFLVVKPIDASDNWVMFDNKRLVAINSSVSPHFVYGNQNNAEITDSKQIDLLSNGFKTRGSGNTTNRSSTFVYWAFAENPIVGSNDVPAVAG